jgi:riboflavin kinase/FMN adenylyltransferase
MIIINHLSDIPPACRGGVVAIGNFDGLHRGHQHLIDAAKSYAEKINEYLTVLSFEPHPKHFFAPDLPPFRLTPLAAKSDCLRRIGVDYFLCLAFEKQMAQLSAENFIGDILIDGLGATAIFVGSDFVFGHNRGGHIDTLNSYAMRGNYTVHPCDLLTDADGTVISSSRIREALKSGNPKLAAKLLGWPWQIIGHVQHGQQLGRSIGFPTANISLDDYQRPQYGVYAARVHVLGRRDLPAIVNIGNRPTVDGASEKMETHIFDFNADLYGQKIAVDIIDFIRPEQKFSSLDELQKQIAHDCELAKKILY